MANPAWPVSLPKFLLLESFTTGAPDGRLRTQTDMGPGMTRLRSSAVAAPMQGRTIMSAAQLATFRAFVRDDLGYGSAVFSFPDPLGGSDLLVRFGENQPSWRDLGNSNWEVSLDLEVMP